MSNGTVDLLKDKDFVREKSVLPNSIYKEFDTRYIDYVTKVAHAGFDIIQVEFSSFCMSINYYSTTSF